MVQNHQIRALRDGATMQFRVADVEELARRRGLGSDPEFSLSDSEMALTPHDVHAEPTGSEEINLSEFALGTAKPEFHTPSDSEKDVLLDDLTVPHGGEAGSSSTILGMHSSGKLPSDSDVRLVPDNFKDASDSDVRLSPASLKGPSDSDVTLVKDDHSSDDFLAKSSPNDTAVRHSPMVGSSAEVPASMSESDFELTPSSVIDALQPESGSDFELSAIDASDEFDSTPLATGPGDSDVTAGAPGDSGINLGRPSDSGINLGGIENLQLGGSSASADSIQLAPLDDDELPKGTKPAPKKAEPAKPKASLAATPPPSTRKGEKDIFEDTDFEVDALDSAEADDRTMQLEASSDFDLDESDSEVFAIDEDDVDENASTAMGPAMLDDESGEFGADDEDGGGLATSGWDVDSDSAPAPVSAGSQGAAVIPTSRDSAEWGGLWVGFLGVGTILVLFLSFVSIDLMRNLYDYRTAGPASGIISSLAGLFK